MKFSIIHSTTYTYAVPVELSPHVFRLRPRSDGGVWLSHFDIHIEPQPSALSPCLDLEGNTVVHAWFDGKTERLSVTSRSEARVQLCGAGTYSRTSKWLINLNSLYRSSISFLESDLIRSRLKDSTQKLASRLPYTTAFFKSANSYASFCRLAR
jgi:transglutaminase-like putative cysteine protease